MSLSDLDTVGGRWSCREYADVLQLFFGSQNASASLPNGYGQQYQLDGKVLDKSHGPVRHTL